MEVYRLSGKRWADQLSGKGAALRGGRWNSTGTEIIYTAENRSLAMAEVAVHFSLGTVPTDYMIVTIVIPDDITIKVVQIEDLPNNWDYFPYISATQYLGNQFINENKYGLLKIPSAITRGDFNILINPFHKDFHKILIIEIIPFPFDKRIFK